MIVAQQDDDDVVDEVVAANIDADEDVTLKDVAAVAKEVEVEENADVQGRPEDSQAQIYKIDLKHADKVLSMQDDETEPTELKEVVKVVTTAKLMIEVVTAAATITAATTPITAPTITAIPTATKRRKGVVIRDLEETVAPSIIIHTEPKSKDKGKWIMVQEPKPLKKQAQIEQDEAYARELEAELNKNINWDDVIEQMDYFKGMRYDDIRPIFEKYFNSNVAFLKKTKDQLEEEESRALKKTSESLEEKAAKKQKLDEEIEELKKHLQIVPDDDDDVYTKATHLAKSSSIEESKKCSWFSKCQKLDIVRVMWSAYHNIYNYTDDLAGKEKISNDNVHLEQMMNNARLKVEEESCVLGYAQILGGEDEQLHQKMVCTLVMDVILILEEKVADDSTGSPCSTTVDQDAPSPSKSLTPTEIQSPVILQDVGNDNLDIEVAHMGNDPLLSVPITEVASGHSSSTASPQTNV
nr:hypothetical protein [Tanacetum cinerariifolium]